MHLYIQTRHGGGVLLEIMDFGVISDYVLNGKTEIRIQFSMVHGILILPQQQKVSLLQNLPISLFLIWGLIWPFTDKACVFSTLHPFTC